jgi:hypothetical protein
MNTLTNTGDYPIITSTLRPSQLRGIGKFGMGGTQRRSPRAAQVPIHFRPFDSKIADGPLMPPLGRKLMSIVAAKSGDSPAGCARNHRFGDTVCAALPWFGVFCSVPVPGPCFVVRHPVITMLRARSSAVEHLTFNQVVVGSIPTGLTTHKCLIRNHGIRSSVVCP